MGSDALPQPVKAGRPPQSSFTWSMAIIKTARKLCDRLAALLVIFHLPDKLAVGTCTLTINATPKSATYRSHICRELISS